MAHVGGRGMQTESGKKEENTGGTKDRAHAGSVYKSMWARRVLGTGYCMRHSRPEELLNFESRPNIAHELGDMGCTISARVFSAVRISKGDRDSQVRAVTATLP